MAKKIKVKLTKAEQKAADLKAAKKTIKKLIKAGVEVDERVKDKKWMLESNPYFFGCEGSNLVDVDDLLEIEERYFGDGEF